MLEASGETYLIVGLGNPGKEYEGTRHNIGFEILKFFAKKKGVIFKPALTIAKGNLAEGKSENKNFLLLLPLTYMNRSGYAVKLCMDHFKISLEHLLIVSDEADLPFAKLRLRKKGSAGTHNGLKSIEQYLQSQDYSRLRVGIGHPGRDADLAEYVLENFTDDEKDELPQVIEEASTLIDTWLAKGIEGTINKNIGD